MDLTTPALLFPAISLLLLAYTNRFLVLAQLIRQLHSQRATMTEMVIRQISNLRLRLILIKAMQGLGVLSFLLCVLTMLLLFLKWMVPAEWIFAISICLLALSLLCSLLEIAISTKAIEIELEDLENLADEEKSL
ncbi:DUF2721 domain-containing protein [Pelobacter seleniigenes]|uniref:DUF2721 domain-containing protein n=1 Tax=Pelobacter seleniigenes TaxID=407188 RepID=UPI0004A6F709|nr:DUF2721 domain-containing protein [Pelobacter seleniigenes]